MRKHEENQPVKKAAAMPTLNKWCAQKSSERSSLMPFPMYAMKLKYHSCVPGRKRKEKISIAEEAVATIS